MATTEEEVLVEPEADTSSQVAPTAPTSELEKLSAFLDQRVLQNVNAAPAAKRVKENAYPVLKERTVTGAIAGERKQIVVVEVAGFLIGKVTAIDFILMQRAAAKDGIKLYIVSAWRSFEEQTRIYHERYDSSGNKTAMGLKKGPAARPGYSNHQSGFALDIQTNMSYRDFNAGRAYSREFLWLNANASKFGFTRPVATEPWHWVHTSDEVVGQSEPELVANVFINSDNTATTAIPGNRSGIGLFLARDAQDKTKAYERSFQMSTSSRDTIYANLSAESIYKGIVTAAYTALHAQKETLMSVGAPATFERVSLQPLVYDYKTGLWGDKEPV